MTQKTRPAIEAEIDQQLPTNGYGAITASNLRAVLDDMADSYYNPLSDGVTVVNSVGLSSNASYLTVANSPVISNGTITLNKTMALSANQFIATPNGVAGTADLRAIVNADLPNSGATAGSYTNANVTVNSQGIVTTISGGTAYLPLSGGTITGNLTVTGIIRGDVPTVANVVAFGADPTNTSDSTTAIQNAINSLTSGGIVYFPPGTYKYSSLTVSNAITLQGTGWSASTLITNSATATCLTMGVSSGLKDLQLASSVTRTNNPYVNIQNNAVLIERLSIIGYFQGILIGATGGAQPVDVQIYNCNFNTPATGAGSFGIFGQLWSNLVIDGVVMSGPNSGTQPDYGLRLLAGDTCYISNTNITKHGTSAINPANGSNCFAVTAVNCSFDNAGTTSGGSVPSFTINPSGGVKDCKFTNCWFGYSAGSFGMAMQPTSSTGLVDGIQFTGCEFVNNGDGGIIWGNNGSGALVKNVVVTGGAFAGNTNTGIRFYGGASGVTITGSRIGPYAARGANGYGIVIDGGSASADVLIAGNNVIGNTTANISDSATGSNVQVYNNNGYNSATTLASVTVGASPVTITAGHTPEVHYLRAGTVSSITQDGTQIFAATPATINLAPNESYVITYSVVPTVTKKLL